MIAANNTTSVSLVDAPAVGLHAVGRTAVKQTTDGRFAVVNVSPRRDGTLRLIAVFNDSTAARLFNFAIHGDRL